jgi:hypothetical protein
MSRFRTHWLALFGGVTLLALSLSTAFGAKPEAGDNVGSQVSAFVHSLQADAEETDEQTEETEDTETEDDTEVAPEEDGAPSDHGQCVAAVAQDPEAVGPPNDNHGGAVSEAARVTCWEDGEDAADGSVEDTSTEASTPGHGHGKGHGHNH